MQIDVYLQVIRRWIWLIVLMTGLAAGASYYIVHKQPVSYTANVQLLVGPTVDNAGSNINLLHASTQLMQTYATLATTRDLMQQVIDKLHLQIGPSALAGQIIATPNTTNNILSIAVHSPRQKDAVAIANAVAEGLVALHATRPGETPSNVLQLTAQMKQLQDQVTSSQARIDQLNAAINSNNAGQNQAIVDTQNKIKDLETQLAAPTDPAIAKQIADITARIQQLQTAMQSTVNLDSRRMLLDEMTAQQTQLSALKSEVDNRQRFLLDQLGQQRNALASLQLAASQQQSQLVSQLGIERTQLADAQRNLATATTALQNADSGQITLVNPAVNAPADQDKSLLIALIAGVAGLVLSLTLAFTFEYLDDRIKTPEELAQATGTQVWGSVLKQNALLRPGASNAAITPTNARIAEAFRLMCMKLTSGASRDICSLLVSDLEKKGASAETASNLAVALARNGKRVILVDADIQQPTLGALFKLEEKKGLADWLTRGSGEPGQMRVDSVPGLTVLPVGTVDGNSINELVWPRMTNLLKLFEREADMVIVAGPPLSSSADGFFLASNLGGVLGVAQRGITHWKQAQETVENMHSFGIQVLGVVFADNKPGRFKMSYFPRLGSGASSNGHSVISHPSTSPETISPSLEAFTSTPATKSGAIAGSNGNQGVEDARV